MPTPAIITKVTKALHASFLKSVGANNIQLASKRSMRFDVQDGLSPQGINRIKVTENEDGTAKITFIQVIEFDVIDSIRFDKVQNAIDGVLKFDPKAGADVLANAMKKGV